MTGIAANLLFHKIAAHVPQSNNRSYMHTGMIGSWRGLLEPLCLFLRGLRAMNIFLAAGGIALIDIILSGDNALVIGAAASRLPRSQRLLAIIWGGVAAVIIRLLLAAVATKLLLIPLLQLIGGIIIFALAVRLLLPEDSAGKSPRRAYDQLLPATLTILVADVTMSLDNVLAVAALAAGNIVLLIIGLIGSMLLLFVASALIARLMEAFSWLIDL